MNPTQIHNHYNHLVNLTLNFGVEQLIIDGNKVKATLDLMAQLFQEPEEKIKSVIPVMPESDLFSKYAFKMEEITTDRMKTLDPIGTGARLNSLEKQLVSPNQKWYMNL